MIRVIRANFAHAKHLFRLRMALDNTKPEDCELTNPEVQAAFFADTLNMLLDQSGQLVFLAFEEHVPVGYISLTVRDLIGRHVKPGISVTGLFVLKAHRNGRVLRRLLKEARAYIEPFDFLRAQAAVYSTNEIMQRHLARQGWVLKAVVFEKELPGGQRNPRPINGAEVHQAGGGHPEGRLREIPSGSAVHAPARFGAEPT